MSPSDHDQDDLEVIEGQGIDEFSAEGQRVIRSAEAELAAGILETVPHGAADAILERQHRAAKAG